MEGGSPESYEKVQMEEHEDEGETPVKTERMKFNNSMEMLKFFDLLPEGAQEEILKNLCRNATKFTKDEDKEGELPVDMKSTVEAYKSAMEGKSDGEKASLYDEYIEAERKKAYTKKYEGKFPSHQLESGLQITLASRSNRDLGKVKVVLRKQDCRDDPIPHKKTRDKIVKSLETKISAGNISPMLTSVDAAEYNVAADALSWQAILKSIHWFCTQYDMTSLLKIPQDVDSSKPHRVAKATQFKDAIKDWQSLNDNNYFMWQEFLL
jgi:hypothetical protein